NQIVDYITGKIVFVSAGGNNFQGLFNARTKNEQIIADGGSISDGKIATYPPYLEALRVKSNYFTKGQKEPNQESNSRFENSADLFAQMWIIASDQVQYWKLVQWWKENRDTNQGQITSLVSFWGGFNNIIESASNPEKLKSDALSYLTALNELMSIDNKSYSTHLPGLETGPDANIQ
ncbi:MAG TPA: hypothetical protein VJB63_03995, partial [Patescibacteria group bacterium]|nr:hypothetical protein [Patescibacteria group bacterium]